MAKRTIPMPRYRTAVHTGWCAKCKHKGKMLIYAARHIVHTSRVSGSSTHIVDGMFGVSSVFVLQ